MRAAICTKYGEPSVVQLTEVAKPLPKENQVLVKIHASSVTSGDARIRRADPFLIRLIFGFKRPRKSILGVVVAGEIEAIGKNVTKFKVGDAIFGTTGMSFGAHAEYQCIKEDGTLALLPENITFNEAAAIPFGATAALHFLRKSNVQVGDNVLIYGASGAIGSIAIQLAKEFGAHVTAVCSEKNRALVSSLGADRVIDYTKEDFTKGDTKYDIIFDTVGKSSFSASLKTLTKTGTILLASANISQMLRAALTSCFGRKKIITGVIKETAEDMLFFKKLIEANRLTSVIDRVYSFEDISIAHTHVDGGHKIGNVILQMNHAN
jgi:2-desacetyl-2-hydroxyethyl bacteriochlorophyllide A dehydrogenase